jgi:hypothetical protein
MGLKSLLKNRIRFTHSVDEPKIKDLTQRRYEAKTQSDLLHSVSILAMAGKFVNAECG